MKLDLFAVLNRFKVKVNFVMKQKNGEIVSFYDIFGSKIRNNKQGLSEIEPL